ncbi:MAG: GntR family transcriptional regulator [Alphaproteobacteria bacterium]|jgi:DNA-binding GntR family transcriptional regulator|nr:GntR family transcriptional regulator [Alphaproteobacteria bacterium]MDP6566145.1 GntR family transcriptional regulator [Alphaproteobacteria bacterium]MDP6816142.1 GntR family transcriptional regulator [Alphaproteobacteria bacterium]
MAVIERVSIAEQTYAYLRGEIAAGRLRQGEPLVEARLAKQLGISRAPVREAAQRLAQEGLLETLMGHSWRVAAMDDDDIRQLYLVRVQLEQLAAAQIIEGDPQGAARQLEKSLQAIRRAAKRGDLQAVVDAETAFHQELCRLSGNKYIHLLHEVVIAHVRLALARDNANYPELDQVAEEHQPLVRAIRAGDTRAAQRAIRHHILDSLKALSTG